jgi:hypothetical protein
VVKPRVSTVLSSYFYYKTGCQVLFVKSVTRTSESAVSRPTVPERPAKDGVSTFHDEEIGIKSGRRLGPVPTSRKFTFDIKPMYNSGAFGCHQLIIVGGDQRCDR